MLWKWEPRDWRTLPKAHAAAGKALKKRLEEVQRRWSHELLIFRKCTTQDLALPA